MKDSNKRAATPRLLVLPPEVAELDAEIQRLRNLSSQASARRRTLRTAAMDAAGWTRCCRCWPSCVDNDGFCGCCLYNHVTGEQMERPASFFAADAAVAPEAPSK